ncbi:hypothetical protein [Flammeovirga agarivorans]|uniref:SnoaL-like domain-containing protein n=1 Tax=Flammeovirga agarivorans TaxID=2726742 RepID=A0A7X8XU58_9BACT|nr:hypothetical protein [Flammeovirga agarivorans]NLR90031.1 hypothetical protein [Flammeovirga agarivorans]
MKKNNLSYLFAFLLMLISSVSFAQEDKQIAELIERVIEANKHANNSVEKINNITDIFRPDAIINITRIGVDGSRNHNVLRKADYKAVFVSQYHQNLHRESNLNMHEVRVQGNVAVASFSLDYTIMADTKNKVVSKGYESMVATLVRRNDKWGVLELNITDIEEEQYQGNCSCELYKNPNTGQVIAKVGAPKGDRFENDLNNVYKRKKGGVTYFMVKGIVFEWKDLNKIWTVDSTMKRIEQLGPAKTDDDAIMLILRYVYKDECSEMKLLQ